MKIACSVLQWGIGIDKNTRQTWDGRVWKVSLAKALDDIAKLRFEGFDCSESDLHPYFSNPGSFRRMIRERKLEFGSAWITLLPKRSSALEGASVNPNLAMSDPKQFLPLSITEFTENDVKNDIKTKIQYAKKMSQFGTNIMLVGGPFFDRRYLKEKYYQILGGYLNDLADKVAKFKMRIALHHHLSTLVQDSIDFEKLYQYADRKLVGICIDTAHLAAAGEDPVKFTERYASNMVHAHFKDLTADGKFVELGKGDLHLRDVLGALSRAGYQGWAVSELDIPSKSAFDSAVTNKKFFDDALHSLR
jgi:sugar phosphate isomerase/epimerase